MRTTIAKPMPIPTFEPTERSPDVVEEFDTVPGSVWMEDIRDTDDVAVVVEEIEAFDVGEVAVLDIADVVVVDIGNEVVVDTEDDAVEVMADPVDGPGYIVVASGKNESSV